MRSLLVRHAMWIVLGLLLAGTGCVLLARAELARARDAFETDARIAHRLLSQRVVQHDAVLATLALLQPAGTGQSAEQRLPALYPQILAVQRRDAGAAWPEARLAAAEAQSRQLRRAVLAGVDLPQGRYELVLASEPGSFALRMDLKAVVPWSEWPMPPETSPVQLTLEHAGQRFVLQPGRADATGWRYEFRKHLAAESQPFDVVAVRTVGWGELPWGQMLAWTLGVAALLAALQAWQRQRAARRRAEELLRLGQVARLNTLGELAAGMAHELNQPLAALLANTQAASRLLAEDPPELDTARGAMQQAADQARRASDVLGRLRRAVERPGQGTPVQSVSLAEAVRKALDLLDPEIARRQVATRVDGADAAFAVRAEPVALEQIIHNLLMNALQALDQVPQEERTLRLELSRQGDEGRLSVIDSGPGIAPDALAHVFEPFYSTRDQGLGLGLSLCESLATGMGGRLQAAHGTPRGAAFHLQLPLAGTA
ncbi:two-component sensor histidine kinase [Caenimonas sedimenti]|uniref:histidine kinase n=1 Tax=Caenimonas sedimenti TaxID=2596921 RepID=A0A562ZER8_9BURK|nr:ATP-binding protein [Caenimonas sedimenti]TWO65010.1 two-component sensor histidine kinase [Caenimonas sedimenti]